MTLNTWLGFLLASLIIAVTPGPGAVLSMSTGMRHGYRTALRGILGLQLALLIQIVIVALGVGALLATSELAFSVMKFLGALYLTYLGVQRWRAPVLAIDAADLPVPTTSIFRQAVLVNMTNPKAIVFICALVPQFIDLSRPLILQYVQIALTLCLTDMAIMSCYAQMGSRLAGLFSSAKALRWQNRFFGGLFVAAGLALVFSGRA